MGQALVSRGKLLLTRGNSFTICFPAIQFLTWERISAGEQSRRYEVPGDNFAGRRRIEHGRWPYLSRQRLSSAPIREGVDRLIQIR